MASESPKPLLCLTLASLREARDWPVQRLADEAGVSRKTLWAWENNEPPSRERLEWLAGLMGYDLAAIDAVYNGLKVALGVPEAPLSPVDPAGGLLRRIQLTAIRVGLAVSELTERHLVKLVRAIRSRKARRHAKRLWARLKGRTLEELRLAVESAREARTWAFAELLCNKSIEAASDRADRALELAALACRVAELGPGSEEWRSRLRGYALAFLANARRVANDLDEAEKAFAQAWKLWEAGAAADPGLLAGWRLFDLEASLRREQREFAQALARLHHALALAPLEARGRILLKRAFTLQQKGDAEQAIESLREAAPLIDGKREPHRLFALRFNLSSSLCDLHRYAEAEALLPGVRELAVAQRKDLDMLRTVWLSARVDAGLGRTTEAEATFEQVRREFKARKMDYDYALVTLDLSALLLGQGSTSTVRSLAEEMVRIFTSHNVHREALAALILFHEAAREERVTVELTRRLIVYLNRAKTDPRLRFEA